MPRGGHARVGPVMLNADERKLRGSRTRERHRVAEHSQRVADEIERELAQNLDGRSSDSESTGGDASGQRRDDHPGRPLASTACDPPEGLSADELKYWTYYAPKLRAQKRLTLLARDTLAGYCSALAVIADLRKELSEPKTTRKEKTAVRRELRQYLAIKRLYESDLLLNPATAARHPGFDDLPPVPDAGVDVDEFDREFDDDTSVQ